VLAPSKTMSTFHALALFLRARYDYAMEQKNEDGYTIETVIIVAGLAAVAIAVIAILTVKITDKANGINLG
jgi:predicted membrane protein